MPTSPDPEDERESALSKLKAMQASAEVPFGRSQDDDCDECGSVEGSVTVNEEQGWTLCTGCKNDPEVLARHAE